MEIKLATLSDVQPICKLLNEFFLYNANLQPEYCNAANELGSYPESVIKSKTADIFIAIDNGEVIGMLHISETQTPPYDSVVPHRYAEIIDLMATASYRRKGVGSLLMNAAKEWSRERGLDYIELFVLSNAEGGKSFYENEGFEIVSHNMRCKI